jgi:hypothetical protein
MISEDNIGQRTVLFCSETDNFHRLVLATIMKRVRCSCVAKSSEEHPEHCSIVRERASELPSKDSGGLEKSWQASAPAEQESHMYVSFM